MSLLLLLLFCCLVKTDKNFQVELQPGHEKQDYDSVEEVRGHNCESKTEKPAEDEHLLKEAILDVAYYLRRFKFSGFDPRYLAEGENPEPNLFVEFPSPPLRNIHWEVKKNCESSFVECVEYLQEQISQTVLPRHLDSLTIAKQNGWSFITDLDLIKTADDECLKLLEDDANMFNVFSSPLEKFKWLTSASYYMCFYTMRENQYLRNFTDDCDNFAACIDWNFGPNNRDVRSNNAEPFACAFYSFCPDPCCPYKHKPSHYSCGEASPCNNEFTVNSTCAFVRKENVNFDSLTLNQWNYSCDCGHPGLQWDSRSGMCVDIDECMEPDYPCCHPVENCRNLFGSYKCVCNPLGFRSVRDNETCQQDPILIEIFNPPEEEPEKKANFFSNELWTKIRNFFSKTKSFMMAPFKKLKRGKNKKKIP